MITFDNWWLNTLKFLFRIHMFKKIVHFRINFCNSTSLSLLWKWKNSVHLFIQFLNLLCNLRILVGEKVVCWWCRWIRWWSFHLDGQRVNDLISGRYWHIKLVNVEMILKITVSDEHSPIFCSDICLILVFEHHFCIISTSSLKYHSLNFSRVSNGIVAFTIIWNLPYVSKVKGWVMILKCNTYFPL